MTNKLPSTVLRTQSTIEQMLSNPDVSDASKLADISNAKRRFAAKLVSNNQTGCIEWTGSLSPAGYGRLSVHDYPLYAHRLAYIFRHGCIPAEMHICHRCDNPKCVNAEHLFLGTRADNMKDRDEKRRVAHGETSGAARLSASDVEFIRTSGVAPKRLAEQFGVGRSHIYHIQQNRRWKG